MAVNKNALLRYLTLDECFRNTGRRYNIDDLLEKINQKLYAEGSDGIQKRQLYDDINFMQSSGGYSAPIERGKNGRRTYFYYEEPGFSITNEPINPAEANHIKSAIQILSRFSGAPQFEWIEELLPRLESKFGLIDDKQSIINYEDNVDYVGSQFIQPIFHAIHNKRVLEIVYKPYFEDEMTHIFHPYYLKQHNNRWFVFGYEEKEQNEAWVFALDRILSINELDQSCKPCNIDWEDYLYDIIGVTRLEGEPQEIKLLFHDGGEYVKTKPLHATQKVKETQAGLEVRIKVIPNFELKKLILSFGNQVEVLQPQNLRDEIKGNLESAMKYYESS